jgi:hypothetical protein
MKLFLDIRVHLICVLSGREAVVTDSGAVLAALVVTQIFTGFGYSRLVAAPLACQQHGFLGPASYQFNQLGFFPSIVYFHTIFHPMNVLSVIPGK